MILIEIFSLNIFGLLQPSSNILHGIFLVTSCYIIRDKLQPDEPLGLYADLHVKMTLSSKLM